MHEVKLDVRSLLKALTSVTSQRLLRYNKGHRGREVSPVCVAAETLFSFFPLFVHIRNEAIFLMDVDVAHASEEKVRPFLISTVRKKEKKSEGKNIDKKKRSAEYN